MRCAAAGDPQELDDSPLSGLEAETQAEQGGVVGEWDPGASLESVALFKDRYNCNALIGAPFPCRVLGLLPRPLAPPACCHLARSGGEPASWSGRTAQPGRSCRARPFSSFF